jgi:copper(I)-binding protein
MSAQVFRRQWSDLPMIHVGRLAAGLAILIAMAWLSACSPSPSGGAALRVSDAWTAATPEGATVGAGYLTIANGGTRAVRLVGVESVIAERVEVHSMSMEGGIMRMRPVEGVEIAAGGNAAFEPSGMHLMLIGLKRPLLAGERVSLVLIFDNGERIEVSLEVRARGAAYGH